MKIRAFALLILSAILFGTSERVLAQVPSQPLTRPPDPGADKTKTLPNLSDRSGWPRPVADNEKYSYLLLDQLEYRNPKTVGWDILGWYGGDYKRYWFKSEGSQTISTRRAGGIEAQALYGKSVSPFFDLQYGLRLDTRPSGERVFGVLALQGLAPYRFDIEPALFVDQRGNVSARFTATYETFLTQRLVLQPRFETNLALQEVRRFGVGSGLNDTELGLRLRYEVRREFAPYIGVSFGQSFGGTASIARSRGEPVRETRFVTGIRLWY